MVFIPSVRSVLAVVATLATVVPMTSLARAAELPADLPDGSHFTVTLGQGRTIEIGKSGDVYEFRVAGTSIAGTLPASEVEAFGVDLISHDSDQLLARVSVPDAIGGHHDYFVDGALSDGAFHGSLVTPGGELAETITIESPGGELETDLVVVIIVGVGVVAVLACLLADLMSDCAGECKDSCEDNGGVKEFYDGVCGRCACECEGSPN